MYNTSELALCVYSQEETDLVGASKESPYQGRIKRRGHATAIYQIANGRGRASKNRQEIIARALYTLETSS